MMPSVEYFTFFTLMEESITFLPKNRKLMSFVALSSLVLCSCFFLLSKYYLQPAIKDCYVAVMKFLTPDLMSPAHAMFSNLTEYMAQIPMDEIIFSLGNSVLTFFLGIAAILIFATSYTKEMLSLKSLLSMIAKKCRMTLVTTVYLCGLLLGYFFAVGALASVTFMFPNPIVTSLVAVVVFIAWSLSLYLSSSWIMAIVVSVVEENYYGSHVRKRAAALVEENKMEGFMLNFCYTILALVIPHFLRMILDHHKGLVNPMVCEVLLVNFSIFLKIWLLVAYTSFYFHCKMFRGEKIELHGSV